MRNLVGEFRHKLDAKGRLSLPADFRRSIPEVLMVTQAPTNDHLMVYDVDGFGAWVDSLFEKDGGYSSSNSQHIALRRELTARATRVDLDGSGRIGISAELRAAADLQKDVVLVGNTDHFEIWDAKRWDEFCNSVDLSELFD